MHSCHVPFPNEDQIESLVYKNALALAPVIPVTGTYIKVIGSSTCCQRTTEQEFPLTREVTEGITARIEEANASAKHDVCAVPFRCFDRSCVSTLP